MTVRERMLRVERHALGPRLHVAGRRVHAWHLGVMAALMTVAAEVSHVRPLAVLVMGALAVWLILRDWRNMHPATRDTAASKVGVHRLPGSPPRPARDRVPALAAVATAAVGALNVGSALMQELPARVRVLLSVVPAGEVRLAHALALPAGLALIGASWPLARRRRRAAYGAVFLLVLVGGLNLVKGLDAVEAAVSWALAAALWQARGAFWVRHSRDGLLRTAARAIGIVSAGILAAMALVSVAAGHATPRLHTGAIPAATLSLLTMTGGPGFRHPFGWVAIAIGVIGAGSAATAAALLLAPLRPAAIADAVGRRRAAALVRRHGADTLSAFKLRQDLGRLWSPDGRAMAAFRVEAGTLLLAGDPIGPADAIPALLETIATYARERGLALGTVGASEAFSVQARAAGLRRVYLGDEAIVPTGEMDLSGGDNKSLRKAVARVRRHGYTASLRPAGDLDALTRAEMEELSERWREGAPERGFSMASDRIVDELLPDALVVLGHDGHGRLRGFLHFVPVFGDPPSASLGFMRRDRDTPNGLNDFLVVEAARLLGEHAITEFSLNFAAYGRWLRAPGNRIERVLARAIRRGDRWFQIERLMRFNAKFHPRWQPRYLLFDRVTSLPRVGLAAGLAEGHMPRPPRLSLPGRRSAGELEAAGGPS